MWHSVLCINWHRSFLLYNHNTRAFCSHLDRYKTITEIKEKIIYKFSARYTVSERSSWGRFTNNKRHEALLKCCLWTTHTSAWHWPVWITNKFHALRSRLTESRIFQIGADLEVCLKLNVFLTNSERQFWDKISKVKTALQYMIKNYRRIGCFFIPSLQHTLTITIPEGEIERKRESIRCSFYNFFYYERK